MDSIKEIFNENDNNKIIEELQRGREHEAHDIKEALKALDPKMHDVNDRTLRPDKKVRTDDQQIGNRIRVNTKDKNIRIEKVNRNAVAFQKLIIGRAAAFLFGNKVLYNAEPQNKEEEQVLFAFNKIIKDAKTHSLNKIIAKKTMAFGECAEYWYPVQLDERQNRYGFDSEFKLRCTLWAPDEGNKLYPYFDEHKTMIAFSREFSRKRHDGTLVDYFETTTKQNFIKWERDGDRKGNWELSSSYPKINSLNKIPIVFAYQKDLETQDVDHLINRYNTLLSNFSDTNDYHASPKLVTKGELKGFSKKGESGGIFVTENEGDIKYLSWDHAPESVKLELDVLYHLIHTLTQTPDISFDSVKGLNLSGIALKLLFMDAHLKVEEKRIIFDDYLKRRVNIIKAYIAQLNVKLARACQTLEIEPEIVPYMLTDDMERLNFYQTANGGKPIMSQEESIDKGGYSTNVEATMEKLRKEQERDNTFSLESVM